MRSIKARVNLDPRWEIIPGITVKDEAIEINPEEYFFRYENPQWKYVDWETVQNNWESLNESSDKSLEQKCLEFISKNAHSTNDPSVILENSEKVYSFLFDRERVNIGGKDNIPDNFLQILKEASTLMSLNRVELSGHASNVGPAWFFPIASQKVFNLSDEESMQLDELYHGGFYTESRRVDGIKAHVALGGRLVHGCQSAADMAGGCVLEYGANIQGFHNDLASFRDNWISMIKSL